MTKTPSPEEISRQYQEWTRQQREMENERNRVRGLVIESDGHNRRKCDCEGCMYWWFLTVTLDEMGQFKETLLNIKTLVKKKGISLYIRDYILQLRMRGFRAVQPIWIAYNRTTDRKWVYGEI